MFRKFSALGLSLLLITGFAGCSGNTADSSVPETAAPTEPPVSKNLCYITGNGTIPSSQVQSFCAQLTSDGYTLSENVLTGIPADTDAVIFNSPTQDLTKDELDALNAYMEDGGHLLLLLPAYEEEVRFKYLSQFLETYCLTFDYNRISETDSSRTVGDDPYYVQADYITHPENMALYSSAQDSGVAFLENARSFGSVYQEHFSRVHQDVILKTAASVIAEPYGGMEDDPITYEDTALDVMGYARHEEKANASVVYVGASSFLTDANYATEQAAGATAWVHSALSWFMLY